MGWGLVGGWVVVVEGSAVGARLWDMWDGRVAGGMVVVGVMCGGLVPNLECLTNHVVSKKIAAATRPVP